ncbi:MAG: enoyl-CoA hydratase/isomerase family protein [Pseudomonadota bacterium]
MIDVENSEGIWRVTLNRPEKANALTREMLIQLTQIAGHAHADTTLKVFVLTGAGDRAFCAGADVSGGDMYAYTSDPCWTEASAAIAALPCLSIAALNGTLAGGGFCPALACDLRIATPRASFFYPVLKRGYLPQPADVVRLQALVGPGRAKHLLMGGAKIDADTALTWGLIDRIVELSDFNEAIDELTLDARAGKSESIAAIKRLFDGPTGDDLADCYRAAYDSDPAAIARISGRATNSD